MKTDLEKKKLKAAKSKWLKHMRKLYPDFQKRKWASVTYRINHPQLY